MKLIFIHPITIALASLLLTLTGCKREDDVPGPNYPPAFSQGLIKKVTSEGGSRPGVYEFEYGNDEVVDSIVITEMGITYAKVFQHLPGLVVADVSSFGPGVWADSTWLDSKGRPERSLRGNFGGMGVETRYVYDNDGQLTHLITGEPGTTENGDTTWHVWADGNMVASYTSLRDTVFYHYDGDKPYQRGEARNIATLTELGRNMVPGINLQTGYTNEGRRTNFSFEYDGSGRITQIEGAETDQVLYIEYQ